jgi:hypothetical protein
MLSPETLSRDRGAPSTDDLLRWDREHVWHAFTQMQEYEPLLIEAGFRPGPRRLVASS